MSLKTFCIYSAFLSQKHFVTENLEIFPLKTYTKWSNRKECTNMYAAGSSKKEKVKLDYISLEIVWPKNWNHNQNLMNCTALISCDVCSACLTERWARCLQGTGHGKPHCHLAPLCTLALLTAHAHQQIPLCILLKATWKSSRAEFCLLLVLLLDTNDHFCASISFLVQAQWTPKVILLQNYYLYWTVAYYGREAAGSGGLYSVVSDFPSQ